MNFKLPIICMAVFSLAACEVSAPPPSTMSSNNNSSTSSNNSSTTVAEKAIEKAAQMSVPGYVNVYLQWPKAELLSEEGPSEDLYSKNYMLAIDTSGSMDGSCQGVVGDKIDAAKQAAIDFVSNIPPEASVGLAVFGGEARLLVPLGPNNHTNVQKAIGDLRADGGTPMSKALDITYKQLEKAGSAQFGYGEYHQVILGDGEPSSAEYTVRWIDYVAQETPINVTAIGFCANLDVLRRPAVNFQPANNADELRSAFASVLAEAEQITDQGF